jgi:hypothetical protein
VGSPFYGAKPVSSSGGVTSFQLKATPGRMHWLFLFNNNAAVRYAQLFDSLALPADGASPLFLQSMAPSGSVPKELAFPPDGFVFTNGLWICISTTALTKTLAAADLAFTAGIT